jgi:phage gpG-like protein
MIRIEVGLRGVEQAVARLRAVGRGLADLSMPLRAFGEHLVGSVKRNFEVGGRPAWIPSRKIAAHTRRARGKGRSPKTLVDTGTLQNSIQVRAVDARSVTVGTNVRYAAVHQEGFHQTVAVPQHLRHIRRRDVAGMVERISKKTGAVYTRKEAIARGFAVVKAHNVRMTIPPRPFLVVQPASYAVWERMLTQHIRQLAGDEGRSDRSA